MRVETQKELFSYIKGNSFDHQIEGTRLIVRNPHFLLADEPGAGKTKQVIDAAQVLFARGIIDRAIVICPATLRSLWFDEEVGQISQFIWEHLPLEMMLYHSKMDYWDRRDPKVEHTLKWLITNYEYLRKKENKNTVRKWANESTLLVLDESSYIKSWNSQQTKAVREIRERCGRVVLLNGTFVTDSPQDMFAQCNVMDMSILQCKYLGHFRDNYGIMGGFKGRQVVGWRNLDELKARVKPYYIRRLKKNCLDLPDKLPPVKLTCPLSTSTWRMYEEMKKDWVTWLEENKKGDKSIAKHATTKAIRLCQLTSGYLGGFKDPFEKTKEVSQEKTDFFLKWYAHHLTINPTGKVVVWCRFKLEALRLYRMLLEKGYPNIGLMIGGQSNTERQRVIRLLDPRYAPDDQSVCNVATLGSGSVGLNFAAADTSVYLSTSSNLSHRIQSEERVHRTGQKNDVSTIDIIATGPTGQRTMDHWNQVALNKKTDMATWTLEEWLQILKAA